MNGCIQIDHHQQIDSIVLLTTHDLRSLSSIIKGKKYQKAKVMDTFRIREDIKLEKDKIKH